MFLFARNKEVFLKLCYFFIRLTEWNSKSKIPYIPSYKTRSEKGSINHDFADISRVAFNDFGRHHRSCVRQHILIQHSAQCVFSLFYPLTNLLVHTEMFLLKVLINMYIESREKEIKSIFHSKRIKLNYAICFTWLSCILLMIFKFMKLFTGSLVYISTFYVRNRPRKLNLI